MPKNEDLLKEAKEAFRTSYDAEQEQRIVSLDDLRFAKLGEQWDDRDRKKRELDGRPCLTINRIPAFLRQVTNDARQNRPAIKCHPVGNTSDKETAEILDGLIRNIEYSSNADVAYDTALDFAATMGFGYFVIRTDYACDDSWDLDLMIERVANPFSIYADPYSTAADSSDWNDAFITTLMKKSAFIKRWKDADQTDFKGDGFDSKEQPWFQGESLLVAEYWQRREQITELLKLSNDALMFASEYEKAKALLDLEGVTIIGTRPSKTYKVVQHMMNGSEVLETNEWRGKYIPIVPVYGDEVNVEGKRYFKSLFRDAKDAQKMYNFWRPLATDTPLPTPTGWTTMGDVRVGDQLFDELGRPCNVVGKSPVHIHRDCFKVSFDDGSHIVADAEHPWVVEERGKRTTGGWEWSRRTITTSEMVPGKHFIDVAKPLVQSDADLPIDPYLLGFWLGDGDSAVPRLTPGDADIAEVRSILEGRGLRLGNSCTSNGTRHGTFTVLGQTAAFRKLGLLGNKHVPDIYLRASESQRREVLQGLMDSDGWISKTGRKCGFVTTNEAIARGFAELVRSLGIKAVALRRQGRHSQIVGAGSIVQEFDQFSFSCYADEPVFKLSRKVARMACGGKQHFRRTKRHRIVSVVRVPSVPVQCVAIDAPSHLFLAGKSMVPTHNTATAELVALAPKAPWTGPVGMFATEADKWSTANTENHATLEYDVVPEQPGAVPQRQPFAGPPAGALQEALNASDDMKSIMGIYDASLGARSNETSGRAILARQREGDVSTFHIIDNLSRAIRHGGRILIDLIPKHYDSERVIRVIKEDGSNFPVPINQPVVVREGQPPIPAQQAQMQVSPEEIEQLRAVTRIYDLKGGKYDATVSAGPGFTTRREEAAAQMIEFVRAFPQVAPFIGDLIAKHLDWPGADEIQKRLNMMLPPQAQGQGMAIVQQLQGMLQKQDAMAKQAVGQLQQQIAELSRKVEDKTQEHQLKAGELKVKAFEAETRRAEVMKPETVQQPQMDPLKAKEMALRARELEIQAYEAETERIKAISERQDMAQEQLTRQVEAVSEAMQPEPVEPPQE